MSSAALRSLTRRSAALRAANTFAFYRPNLATLAPDNAAKPPIRPLSTQQQHRRRRARPKHSSQFQTADTSQPLPETSGTVSAATSSERLLTQSTDLLENAAATPSTYQGGAGVGGEPFSPDVPVDEYLKMASLSPWVPCPDPVARRMLEVAKVVPDDVHYDLGCGDGRVNFHALDGYGVRRTVGVDVDASLVRRAEDRLGRRHPKPDNVSFVEADLLDVDGEGGGGVGARVWDEIANEATVVTMYFVEEALQKLKPMLEDKLGNSGVRVITCGYEMKGWSPRWVEVILGLPVHLYVMRNDEEEPPTPEELRAAAMEGVLDEEDVERVTRDGGEWRAADELPEPEVLGYRYDPDERVDGHWDWDETETYEDEEDVGDHGGKKDK